MSTPEFLGVQISGRGFLLRGIEAVLASMVAFVMLFYVPTILPTQFSGFLIQTGGGLGSKVLSNLVSPTAPTLGLLIVLLVFAGTFIRGTWAYGYLVVLNGLAFIAYVYSFFQGGMIQLEATGDAFGAADASLKLSIGEFALMLVFMVPPLLTVLKGVVLLRYRRDLKPGQTHENSLHSENT